MVAELLLSLTKGQSPTNMAITNNLTLVCYNFGSDGEDLYVNLRFWVEGVLGVSFAILGILFNTVTTVILSDREMINGFNMM